MEIKNGDLLEAFSKGEIAAIGHQTNCKNAFGPIIAALIKKKFPAAWEADCKFTEEFTPEEKLGKISVGEVGQGYVINLYGQQSWSMGARQTDYEALYSALEAARDFLKEKGLTSFGLPYKVGSNRGGGDWRIVSAIIEVVFENSGIDVVIYKI